MSKKECCGVHINWMNEEYDKFDDYYCDNFKNNDLDLNIYKSETKNKRIVIM